MDTVQIDSNCITGDSSLHTKGMHLPPSIFRLIVLCFNLDNIRKQYGVGISKEGQITEGLNKYLSEDHREGKQGEHQKLHEYRELVMQ